MIDPISAITAITTASGAISSAIKAGKDIAGLSVPLSRYAKAEAELNFGANRKKNSFFSRFTNSEASAIDKFFGLWYLSQFRSSANSLIFFIYFSKSIV